MDGESLLVGEESFPAHEEYKRVSLFYQERPGASTLFSWGFAHLDGRGKS